MIKSTVAQLIKLYGPAVAAADKQPEIYISCTYRHVGNLPRSQGTCIKVCASLNRRPGQQILDLVDDIIVLFSCLFYRRLSKTKQTDILLGNTSW